MAASAPTRQTIRFGAYELNPRAAELLLDLVANDKSREVRYAALRYCERVAAAEPEGELAGKLYEQLATSFEKDDGSRASSHPTGR